ncbi:MAG: hypothetical protein M0P71_02410 [Melioribacteraceae bacterium]|nr:hypothetical protein [Melioribacteraceae bacterium]
MRYILTTVDSIQKYRFFDKLNRAIKLQSNEIVFVTIRLSIYLIGKLFGRKVFLLKKSKINNSKNKEICENEFLEVKIGQIDKNLASLIYSNSKRLIHSLNEKYFFKLIYIFNGLGVIDRAVEDFAFDVGINCKYFELSNIKGKIFLDNYGVNANSSLYTDIEQLNHLEINLPSYNEWYKNYIDKIKFDSYLPQEKSAKKINFWYALDLFGFWFLNVHRLSKKSIIEKIKTKLFLSRLSRINKNDFEIKKPFILAPLQVSDDSQLLFHSSFNNIELINAANKIANEKGMSLVVKIHPAEENIKFIKNVFRLKDECDFILSNSNIYELLESCELIITINSSVGLLAKIMEKEVIFIGRTYYEKINSQNMPTYIESFLLKTDFWDNKCELSENEIFRLLN